MFPFPGVQFLRVPAEARQGGAKQPKNDPVTAHVWGSCSITRLNPFQVCRRSTLLFVGAGSIALRLARPLPQIHRMLHGAGQGFFFFFKYAGKVAAPNLGPTGRARPCSNSSLDRLCTCPGLRNYCSLSSLCRYLNKIRDCTNNSGPMLICDVHEALLCSRHLTPVKWRCGLIEAYSSACSRMTRPALCVY